MSQRELELYFGPQHVGMVGNFSITLRVEGDRVLEARANPGYLHRGFEKLMEYRTWIQNFPMVCRINVMDPDPYEMVYAMAVEELAGIEVPARANYIRTIVLEFSRLASHLLWNWGYANMLGFDTLGQWTMGDRDYILDLFEDLTGGRVYHIYIWPGGVRRDLPEGFEEKVLKTLETIETHLPDYDTIFFNNRIFFARAKGIGKITQEEAIELGATGQVLRATGVSMDIRKLEPYAAYSDLDFEIPTREEGDSYSRAMVIREEMEQSISIIRQCFEKMPEGPSYRKVPNPFKWSIPKGEAYVRIEGARGETGLYMVSNGEDKPYRVHFRSPSYPHAILILEKLLKRASIADVGHIMMSLNISAPEVDR
jgi:NADH-quinone oxidoreductase subunit D